MKEVDYASNYPKNVHFYRVGGHDSKKIGIILNTKTNQNISINLNPHEEHLLKIESAEVIYPNIIIDKINNVLIDSNNGYTSTELINHNIYNYPLSLIKNNIVIKNNNQNTIWLNSYKSELAFKSSIIIPIESDFEKEGSFINLEGRSQKSLKIIKNVSTKTINNILNSFFKSHEKFLSNEYRFISSEFENIKNSFLFDSLQLSCVFKKKQSLL
jgi:NADH dehydrogenase/NADH:ubiquinone oxidoreductase subunit G